MRKERLQKIEEYINEQGFVTMEDICRTFQVSMPTVRKDVAELAGIGRIEKVYGGARSVQDDKKNLHLYKNRKNLHQAEKSIIAEKAAAVVSDGDVIYVDSGTTAASMVSHLEGKHVTIITPNLAAINAAADTETVEAYVLGGKFNRDTLSVDNMFAFEFMNGFNIDKAFMASTGYSIEGGIAQDSPTECEIKKHVLSISTEAYLIIDSSKIGRKALVRYADPEEIPNIITDEKPVQEYENYFEEHGITVI